MTDTPLQAKSTQPAALAPWRRWSRAFDAHNLATNTGFTWAIWIIYLASHGYILILVLTLRTMRTIKSAEGK